MLPSLVVEEVRRGVTETLRVQFEPSTALFKDAVRRLIEAPSWVKGPYVQLGLPFVEGASGRGFFKDFLTEFPAHRHQELAWELCGRQGRSTLVASGTGSGKTEAFLYPLLDHVARARRRGVKGIKAIIIYPMNALADDQAGRIAELVHITPAFGGIRAGLFVGSGSSQWRPGRRGKPPVPDQAVMGPDQVITDKEVQRLDPPDLLLTNYKMLDFLMIRPRDQGLWRHNGPDTLRYLVVDELHTFDGAQGTDLAMLIRRLRRRLGCEGAGLICIGTSATLGDASDTASLRDYAGQVFATRFDADAVVTEQRQGFDAFIGDAVVEHLLADDRTVLAALGRGPFASPQEAVAAYLPAFFAHEETLSALLHGLDSVPGRIRLGEELKKHLLFQTLLRTATQAPVTLDRITDRMQRTLTAALRDRAPAILSALLTLVAWARAPHAGQQLDPLPSVEKLSSLVTLRVQIWMQELRRVIATVSADPADISLAAEAGVLSRDERLRLPVVQCRHCRATGWLTLKASHDSRVQSALEAIYASFFARHPDTFLARLYPHLGDERRLMAKVQEAYLCGQCGHLASRSPGQCPHCQSENLVRVHLLNETRRQTVRQGQGGEEGREGRRDVTVHDDICPVCGQRGEQLIIGAQTTTLAAHAVERLWSAPLNPHKKLILFSDSVQDAAHRAGYIEARTESHLLRAGIARGLAIQPVNQPWDQALAALGRCYLDETSPLYLEPEVFVARFIAPGMEGLRDWRELKASGRWRAGSDLPDLIAKRMQWRAVEELSHRADIGRTLTRTGVAVLFPETETLSRLCAPLAGRLREAGGGLEGLTEAQVCHWALGTVLMLIQAGAVLHLGLERLAESGDFAAFEFAPQRKLWISHQGRSGRAPRFVTRDPGRHGFLDLQERPGNPLLNWARLALGLSLYSPGIITLAYEELLAALEQAGMGRYLALEGRFGPARVFGLEPARLRLRQDLQRLVTPSGAQALWVPTDALGWVSGLPAWNSPAECLAPNPDILTATDTGEGGGGAAGWWRERLLGGEVRRVIAHEHTGLLERDERVELQNRFMARAEQSRPWFENLLSATPTLEMGINIGALSSVMLGGVPPNQASFIQRVGRAGRLDGNAAIFTIADASPEGHDQYFFSNPLEMLQGAVEAPAIYLGAAEVLRRQLYAFFFDHWVAEESPSMPDRLSEALDQVAQGEREPRRFPFNYLDFVNRREPELFDAFCRLLGENLTAATRAKLEGYVQGNEEQKNLRARFLGFFEEMLAERESWKARRGKITEELRRLRKRPQDEQTAREIEILEQERAALGQRIQQLNNEQLLEAMTNAGLLPNYAFPEEGVALTTIIHGARSVGGEEYSVPLHRYSRPAHAALAEFAPRNTFFAHKSKVQVDQIDMTVEPATAYRFCARCHHLAPFSDPAAHQPACPQCGDSHWGDESQSRPMLRLKRAVANIDRVDRTRITERDEQRKPLSYRRQLLMNYDPADIRGAWTLESEVALYGFEFLARARFHDLNLGQPAPASANGPGLLIAGDEGPKPGFALCTECGKVQNWVRTGARAQDGEERPQVHAPDCRHRHARGSGHLLPDLFLFREFESECLRILVPTGFGAGERTTWSFMAALQLGLRRRFGGKVDHLRFEVMTEPGGGEGAAKSYILIYDSVPGGTGYLQQMLSGEADTLVEVLSAAYQIIRDCGCQTRTDLDGCYQCVFHYRQGRNRRHISRHAALEMLRELVEGNFRRTRVPGLSEIYVNPAFGSELERRFLPALQALGGRMEGLDERLPPVRVSQDVKAGKTAYLLTVGANRYWVDTQVPLEDVATGLTLCQPDFLISATRTTSAMRPLAVFVDGWEHHRQTLAEDARKRSSLMLRGEIRVWSITFEDIESALQHKSGTDLDSPLSLLMTPGGQAIPPDKLPRLPAGALTHNAIAALLRLLGEADPAADPLAALTPVGRHLLMRSVVREAEVTADIRSRQARVAAALPDWLRSDALRVHLQSPRKKQHTPGGDEYGLGERAQSPGYDEHGRGETDPSPGRDEQSPGETAQPPAGDEQGADQKGRRPGGQAAGETTALQWVGMAEPKFLLGKSDGRRTLAGALVLDDTGPGDEGKTARQRWRQWLRLANLLQATPGAALLTETLVARGVGLNVPEPLEGRALIMGLAALDTPWNQLLEAQEFVARLKPGFVALAQRGLPPPEIGFETCGGDGEGEGDGVGNGDGDDYRTAEALWEAERVVLLTAAQAECAESWRARGYRVIEEGDNWWEHVEREIREVAR